MFHQKRMVSYQRAKSLGLLGQRVYVKVTKFVPIEEAERDHLITNKMMKHRIRLTPR